MLPAVKAASTPEQGDSNDRARPAKGPAIEICLLCGIATAFQPGDPQAAIAAIETVIGLLIEITFIATFTNRFFAR